MIDTSKDLFPKELSHVLKGILAVIIVGSHLHYVTEMTLWSIFNKLGTSVVAMFFFISGYGMMTSIKTNRGGVNYLKPFWLKRFTTILKPFLIITLIYILINWFLYGSVPHDMFLNLYERGETPLPNSWFIFSLIYFYISFYISIKYIKNRIGSISVVTVLILGFILWCIYKGYGRAWWVCALAFPSGMIYSLIWWKEYINRWYVLVLILLFVFTTVYVNIVYLLPLTYVFIPIFIISLCNISHICVFVKRLYASESKRIPIRLTRGVLDFMSGISYELYLVHGAIISLFNTNTVLHSSDHVFSITVFLSSFFFAFLFNRIFNINIQKRKTV